MRTQCQKVIPAPPRRVAYVLFAADEYADWNTAARQTPRGLRWSVPLLVGGEVPFRVTVAATGDGIRVRLGARWNVRIEHHLQIEETDLTRLTVTTTTRGLFGGFARGLALSRSIDTFCKDLTERSFWLRRIRDTKYPDRSPGFPPRPWARDASLEQLPFPTKELEGGLIAIYTRYMCLVIDPREGRFLQAARHADLDRLAAFAPWRPLLNIVSNADGITIEPGDSRVPLHLSARHLPGDDGVSDRPRNIA
jgi:hypothetical protein